MTPLQRWIEESGGLAKTSELHLLGLGRERIAAAVRVGEIERIRQGWYAAPSLPAPQRQAARIGGQLACSSAAAAHGLWRPRIRALHICVPVDARGLRSPTSYRTRLAADQAVVHWSGLDRAGSRTMVSVGACIRQIARCESPFTALIVAESALRAKALSTADFRSVLAELPVSTRRVLETASTRSESGSETVFLHRMAAIGVIVRQQVVVPGVGRVDGLVGERLVIELDSREYHGDPARDRERDARLSALGYRVLRFMYTQVMEEWPLVQTAVLAAIARGDHL